MKTSVQNVYLAKLGSAVRMQCPGCGSFGPHESNGDQREPMVCCEACGEHFDVECDDVSVAHPNDYYLGLAE